MDKNDAEKERFERSKAFKQKISKEFAAAFSHGKTALEGIEGAKNGGMDIAEGKALSGFSKIAKPFLGGALQGKSETKLGSGRVGLSMSYGKAEAPRLMTPGGPAPQQGPQSGPEGPGER